MPDETLTTTDEVRPAIAVGTPYATDDGARMRGRANLGGYFDVPLITRVPWAGFRPGAELWQGGCIQGYALPEDFDFVLSLYPWEKYILGPDTHRVEVTMYDDLGQGFEQVDELAAGVVTALDAGAKVLVHCQAGLNRSGLLAATVLKQLGMSGADAVSLLRENRTDQVLCNSAFYQHVVDERRDVND